jgi:hypothetical protein
MFLSLLAVQLDIESRRHIAIKTLVWEDEADSGMSIGVLTHHFPTRALNETAEKVPFRSLQKRNIKEPEYIK